MRGTVTGFHSSLRQAIGHHAPLPASGIASCEHAGKLRSPVRLLCSVQPLCTYCAPGSSIGFAGVARQFCSFLATDVGCVGRHGCWISVYRCLGRNDQVAQLLRKHIATSLNLSERQSAKVRTVLDAADSLLFGNRSSLSTEQRTTIQELWRELSVNKLRKARIVETPS